MNEINTQDIIKYVHIKFIKIHIINSFKRKCITEIINQLSKESMYRSSTLFSMIRYIETNVGIYLSDKLIGLFIIDKPKCMLDESEILDSILYSNNKRSNSTDHLSLEEFTKKVCKDIAHLIDRITSRDLMTDHGSPKPYGANKDYIKSIMKIINGELFNFMLLKYNQICALVDSKLCDIKVNKEKKIKRKTICKMHKRYSELFNLNWYSPMFQCTDKRYMMHYLYILYFIISSLETIRDSDSCSRAATPSDSWSRPNVSKIGRTKVTNATKDIASTGAIDHSSINKIIVAPNNSANTLGLNSHISELYAIMAAAYNSCMFMDSFLNSVDVIEIFESKEEEMEMLASDIDDNLLIVYLPTVLAKIILSYDMIHCEGTMITRLSKIATRVIESWC